MLAREGFALDGAANRWYSQYRPRRVAGEELRYGIDVSSWQGAINWSKVAASGIQFAFIRGAFRYTLSGELMKDGRFDAYIAGAKAAGLQVGVYVFSQALSVEEAIEEADFLLELVKGYEIELPLVIDYEFTPSGRLWTTELSREERTAACLAFCQHVEEAGYTGMVYANPSMLNGYLNASELPHLWLAHYIDETGYSGAPYEYWQFTSEGGVDGIGTAVDLDFGFVPEEPFEDVEVQHWFYAPVVQAYKAKVVSGVTETSFQPGSTATRGQVVTMIYRMEGAPAFSKAAAFTDLKFNYYKDAISWAAEKGVVEGYSAEEFRPENSITREQLVTLLYRLAGSPAVKKSLSKYTDKDSIHSYALDAMKWAVKNGIITGYEDNTLRPRANANRAEVCAILMRFAEKQTPQPL